MKYCIVIYLMLLFSTIVMAAPQKAMMCMSCHGATGNPSGNYPVLAGKDKDFLFNQLKLFQQRKIRSATVMNTFVDLVPTDEDKRIVSEYFSKQKCTKRCNEKPYK